MEVLGTSTAGAVINAESLSADDRPHRVNRQQPWSTYAVHLTTLTAWAIPTDALLIFWLWKATETWAKDAQWWAMVSLGAWIFLSKWIKLLGHYMRYPADLLLLPVSVVFGYVHGLLKIYALFTLDVVSTRVLYHFPPPRSVLLSVVVALAECGCKGVCECEVKRRWPHAHTPHLWPHLMRQKPCFQAQPVVAFRVSVSRVCHYHLCLMEPPPACDGVLFGQLHVSLVLPRQLAPHVHVKPPSSAQLSYVPSRHYHSCSDSP